MLLSVFFLGWSNHLLQSILSSNTQIQIDSDGKNNKLQQEVITTVD